MIRPNIEREAGRLVAAFGVSKPPIPIREIVVSRGITIASTNFQGRESGFALSQGERRIIGVNTNTSPTRQLFTIAHELGHLTLHHKPLIVDHSILISRRDETSSLGTEQEEIEANAFAAAVLMPEEMLRVEIRNELLKDQDQSREDLIRRLARTFGVSDQAMGYRLVNLNLITGWI